MMLELNKIEAIMEEAEIQLYDNGDSGASDMSNLRTILEKYLHQEPEKEGREGICKVCGKEGMYLETDNMMCDSCWGKPSEQVGGMLQPGEYMRDNEGNITTYEDEQKLSG